MCDISGRSGLPWGIAPTTQQRAVHPDGEVAPGQPRTVVETNDGKHTSLDPLPQTAPASDGKGTSLEPSRSGDPRPKENFDDHATTRQVFNDTKLILSPDAD